jgi:hypothetical protein
MGVPRVLIIGVVGLAAAAPPASAAKLHGPVRYTKSGGIAGLNQRMTIRPDGSGFTKSVDARRNFQLSKKRLGVLVRQVKAADIRHTRSPKQRTPGHIADGMGFSVSYSGHTVRWATGTDDPPARVGHLYSALERIYERYAPSS